MSDDSVPQFSDLGLRPELLQTIQTLGYENPTPIQAGAIPALIAGRDVVGQAQTGTGKTAAFALPLLQGLDLGVRNVQAIVLTPTRELALQVAKAVETYGRQLGRRGVSVLPVYGGQPIGVQWRALRRGVQVVIGTPGRVKDHLQRGSLSLEHVRFFGLDEADEMLNMGFIEDVEWILDHAPASRQVALFSATFPTRIRQIAEKHLKDPVDVKIARHALTVPNIEQWSIRVRYRDKPETLGRILQAEDREAVLIFVRTQQATEALTELLKADGHEAECVHGGISQSQREAVVRRLRARRTRIVVATDVAARGLDVDHIGLVVNFDLPRDPEVYIHRIGRTGRAGRAGRAISFWASSERRLLEAIERRWRCKLEPMRAPGPSEMLTRRRERLAAEVRTLAAGDLSEFQSFAQKLAEEDGLDLAQVAAAMARIAWGEGPLSAPKEPERGRAAQRKHRQSHAPDSREVEIVFPAGKRDRLRPQDVVGAIANETGLPGRIIGSIRIFENATFVSLPEPHVETVLKALQGVRVRGRALRPRRSRPVTRQTARR